MTARNRWGGIHRNTLQESGTVTDVPFRDWDSAGIHLEGPRATVAARVVCTRESTFSLLSESVHKVVFGVF